MIPPQALLSADEIRWNNMEGSVGRCLRLYLPASLRSSQPFLSHQYPKTLLLIGTDNVVVSSSNVLWEKTRERYLERGT